MIIINARNRAECLLILFYKHFCLEFLTGFSVTRYYFYLKILQLLHDIYVTGQLRWTVFIKLT